MKIFTKLGIAFLLVVFTTGILMAQHSETEIAAKMKTLNNGLTKTVIGGGDVDADVIAVGKPMSLEKIKSLNIPTQTTNLKGTDEIDIIGSDANSYNYGPRSRGNAFHCTVSGKILTEFMGWHDVTINPTEMWMCIYEGETEEGEYTLVSASDVSPAPLGLGWVSSGIIDFPLVADKYYLMYASFAQPCGYYSEQAIVPFPVTVAFGEAIGGVGIAWAPMPAFPPDETVNVIAGAFGDPALYYQQLITKDATSYDNDMGIQAIVSPNSGNDLSSAEIVTVNIKNFGTVAQSGFTVSYSMNGGTAVVETISSTINGGETLEHTFAGTVDLSAYGIYEVEAWTDLTGDENANNDLKTKTVENSAPAYCTAGTGSEDEYIAYVLCGSIDNASGWQGGVADYTAIYTAIDPGMSVDMTVTNGNPYATDAVTAWVDWNDDFAFEIGGDEEFVLSDDGSGDIFTGAITAPADATAGMHRMRIRMIYGAAPAPCGTIDYGEVEDYSILIGDPTFGNLEGTVTDADGGAAIEGATVTAGSNTTTTDADGMYSFMDIVTGTYTVSCTADDYVGQTETVVVEDGITATLDFVLVDTGVIPNENVFEDDFESYNAGEMLACQNPEDWTTWTLDPCGADDAYVSDAYAYSGSKSVEVITNVNLVKPLNETDYTSGHYAISFMMYIPSGKDAYWNIVTEWAVTQTWAIEVFFDNGALTTSVGGGTYTYDYDTWMEIKVDVDLNADWAIFTIDGNEVQAWMWSESSGVNAIGAVNFYGNDQTNPCEYYFDDFQLSEFEGLAAPTNFTADVVGGDDVEMSWVAPGGLGYIQWDDGTNTGNGIGITGTSGGTFLVASRWTAADLAPYDGNYMTSITLYPNGDAAATFVLKAWTGANAGTEILSQVVASTNVDEFNEIVLETPIMIDASQELWFGYECTHGAGTFPAGCDDGPAIQDMGDLISVDGGANWTGMSAAYGLDYNWNLAGYLVSSDNGKEIAKPMVKQTITPSTGTPIASGSNGTMAKMDNNSTKGFVGFNVYRDGEIIALEIGESTYTDMDLLAGSYTFEVKAVYDEGLSVSAEPGPITLNIGNLVDRNHVMVEIGTGTWCGFCPGAAMGADDMHEQGLSVGIIEYHFGDKYETTESAARLAYYGLTGYPTAYFDGIISHVGGNATNSMYYTYLPKYEQRINTPTVFEMESYYYNTTGNDYEVYISVEMIDTYSNLDNLKVFAVLTESHIPEAWSSQTEVNFVCRDMIPDATGTDADFSGSTIESYTLGFTIPADYVMANLEMVVFIQDIASTEVLQATIAPFLVGVEEPIKNTIAIYPNPATDKLYVENSGDIEKFQLVSLAGKTILEETFVGNKIEINTTQCNPGMYFIKLISHDKEIIRKVVIN